MAQWQAVPGDAIGRDNNYQWAVYPDGRVEMLYKAGGGAGRWDDNGNYVSDPVTGYATESELKAQGWDPAKAQKDAHGIPIGPDGWTATPWVTSRSDPLLSAGFIAGMSMLGGAAAAGGAEASGAEALTAADTAGGLMPEYGTLGSSAAGQTAAGGTGVAAAGGGDAVLGSGLTTGSTGSTGALGAGLTPGAGTWGTTGALGSGTSGALGSGLLANPQVLGALAGGALAGFGGGNKTGTIPTTSTTNTAIDPWLKTQVENQLDQHANNKVLRQQFKFGSQAVRSGVDSMFEGAGRYGSGSHQGVMGSTLANLWTNIYGQDNQARQDRNVRLLTGINFGGTSNTNAQQPYFYSPYQSVLGGIMAGGALGKAFGS